MTFSEEYISPALPTILSTAAPRRPPPLTLTKVDRFSSTIATLLNEFDSQLRDESHTALKTMPDVNEMLRIDRREQDRRMSFVFVGAHGSGKSTLFKQYVYMIGKGFSRADMVAYVPAIHVHILKAIRTLIHAYSQSPAADNFPLPTVSRVILSWDRATLTPRLGGLISDVWRHQGIKSMYLQRGTLGLTLPTSTDKLLDDVRRISQTGYVPTQQDLVHAYVRGAGAVFADMEYEGSALRVVDVDGSVGERRKWWDQFEMARAAVITISMDFNDYDPDGMSDVLNSVQWLMLSPFEGAVVAMFTKRDVFEQQFGLDGGRMFQSFFPDYEGEANASDAAEYFQEQFRIFATYDKELYCHSVNLLDQRALPHVMQNVFHLVVRQSLASAGLCGGMGLAGDGDGGGWASIDSVPRPRFAKKAKKKAMPAMNVSNFDMAPVEDNYRTPPVPALALRAAPLAPPAAPPSAPPLVSRPPGAKMKSSAPPRPRRAAPVDMALLQDEICVDIAETEKDGFSPEEYDDDDVGEEEWGEEEEAEEEASSDDEWYQSEPEFEPESDPHAEVELAKRQRRASMEQQLDGVREEMRNNIDRVLDRDSHLDDFVQPASIQLQSAEFHSQSRRTKSAGGACGPPLIVVCLVPCLPLIALGFLAKKAVDGVKSCAKGVHSSWKQWRRRRKKKKSSTVDEIFADTENVFNGLAALLLFFEPFSEEDRVRHGRHYRNPISRAFLLCVFHGPMLLLLYSGVSVFSLAIMLPTCFTLLVLRTKTIEKKVDKGFAVRQRVLAAETKKKKSLRVFWLMLRGLPMIGIVFVWPLVAVYYVLPSCDGSIQTCAVSGIGGQLCAILVLQVLGVIRSYKSFQKRKQEQDDEYEEERLELEKAEREKLVQQPPTFAPAPETQDQDAATDEEKAPPSFQQIEKNEEGGPPESRFSITKSANYMTVLTLVVESVQMATFAFYTQAEDAASSSTQGPLFQSWADEHLLRAVFLSPSADSSGDGGVSWLGGMEIYELYMFGAFAVSGLLLLLFLVQFVRELRVFGMLKLRKIDQDAANKSFFHSFMGSIIYGHGDLMGVSPLVSISATVLSDLFFVIVTEKLLLLLSCDYSSAVPVLKISPSLVCWEGQHRHVAAAALVLFSIYVPLSAMIAPMLSEAQDVGEVDDITKKRKDIRYIKPFLSAVTVVKCAMLVGVTFFGQQDAFVTVLVSFGVSLALAIITMVWFRRTRPQPESTTPGTQQSSSSSQHQLEPASLGAATIWRALAFVGGMWGALLGLMLSDVMPYSVNEFFSGYVKFVFLVGGLAVLAVVGVVWYRVWVSRHRRVAGMLWKLKDPETFDTATLQTYQEAGGGPVSCPVRFLPNERRHDTPEDRQCLVFDATRKEWSVEHRSPITMWKGVSRRIQEQHVQRKAVNTWLSVLS